MQKFCLLRIGGPNKPQIVFERMKFLALLNLNHLEPITSQYPERPRK